MTAPLDLDALERTAKYIADYPARQTEQARLLGECILQLIAEVRALRAENERLRADAARYQRLRVLGAAVYGTEHLTRGLVSRFTNLDEIVDYDIALHPSRGEAQAMSAIDVREILARYTPLLKRAGLSIVETAELERLRLADMIAKAVAWPQSGDTGAILREILPKYRAAKSKSACDELARMAQEDGFDGEGKR